MFGFVKTLAPELPSDIHVKCKIFRIITTIFSFLIRNSRWRIANLLPNRWRNVISNYPEENNSTRSKNEGLLFIVNSRKFDINIKMSELSLRSNKIKAYAWRSFWVHVRHIVTRSLGVWGIIQRTVLYELGPLWRPARLPDFIVFPRLLRTNQCFVLNSIVRCFTVNLGYTTILISGDTNNYIYCFGTTKT